MPSIIFENSVLAFTNCMTRESDFGGYSYSFIIDENTFCDKVREALSLQKTQIWTADKNTNDFIIKKSGAKHKDDVAHEPTREMMKDTDLLVTVKNKTTAIENSKKVPLARGTTADLLIDVFEFEYGKKQFICVRAHSEKGCTVKVKKLIEFSNGPKYFDFESDAPGINAEAIKENTETSDEIEF